MAHNIEVRKVNGVEIASFAESTENGTQRAWHSLGQIKRERMTVVDALKESHSDYTVTKQPIAALSDEIVEAINNGQFINAAMLKELIVSDKQATFRSDYNETLGIVSPSYGIISNEDAFGFIDDICTAGKGTACVDCAGVLNNGGKTFVTAKLDPISLKGGHEDLIDMYLVFSNSFDGKSAMTAMVTPVRVVCQNTLNYALTNNISRWVVRHTVNCNQKVANVAEAARTLKLFDAFKDEFQQSLDALAKVRVTEKEGEIILAKAFMSEDNFKVYSRAGYDLNSQDLSTRTKNQMTALLETAHNGVGQSWLEPYSGTWLVNAMSCYHENTAPNKSFDKQFESVLSDKGAANKRIQNLYDQLMLKVA